MLHFRQQQQRNQLAKYKFPRNFREKDILLFVLKNTLDFFDIWAKQFFCFGKPVTFST